MKSMHTRSAVAKLSGFTYEEPELRSHILSTSTPWYAFQTLYQLCDLDHPDIKRIIYSEKNLRNQCDVSRFSS